MKRLTLLFFAAGLLVAFQSAAQQAETARRKPGSSDPRISVLIQEISKDTLTKNILYLQNLGTRYEFAPNRREVAEVIRQKFVHYGYADAVLDSFKLVNDEPPHDTTWQYNVMATLQGAGAPNEVYIICAHHDSYAAPDPLVSSPGADDDASGTAAVLEFARILKEKNFTPEATIRFLTIAGEELMYYTQGSGASYYAAKAVENHEDIRLLLDLDVIAHNLPGLALARIPHSYGEVSDWTFDLTSAALADYTPLTPVPVEGPSGNAQPFMEAGYPYTFFYEYDFNPYMHSVNDVIDSCDMDYCSEIVRAACASLLTEQFRPVPQGLRSIAGKDRIGICWKSTANKNLSGYDVYRSIDTIGPFVKLNSAIITDTSYFDFTVESGKTYYYQVTSTDKEGYTSTPSNKIKTSLFLKDKELLVIKDSKGGLNNPTDERVIGFYDYLFSGLDHDFINASDTDSITLPLLGRYRNLVWLSNSFSTIPSVFVHHRDEVEQFFDNGGNMLLANFQISYLVEGNTEIKQQFQKGSPMYDRYRISAVKRNLMGMFNGAWPVAEGYDSIYVDSSKSLTNVPRHIRNLETFTPAPGGTIIYRFDSEFDTTQTYGNMKGKPVGIEYIGNDYKVISLSAPLYYLDSAQAKRLVEFVINEKFKPGVGIPETWLAGKGKITLYQNYPNPVRGETVIRYSLKEPMDLTIGIKDVFGREIMEIPVGWQQCGSYERRLNLQNIPGGLYLYILKSDSESVSGKMVILR